VVARLGQYVVDVRLHGSTKPLAKDQLKRVGTGLSKVCPRRQGVKLRLEECVWTVDRRVGDVQCVEAIHPTWRAGTHGGKEGLRCSYASRRHRRKYVFEKWNARNL